MAVYPVKTAEEYQEALDKHAVVVVDWFATWCGPCKLIAPQLSKWSEAMPEVHFLKVDVDALPELAQDAGIRAMPSFHIFQNGKKVDEFVSANPPALLKIIEKWRPAAAEEKAEGEGEAEGEEKVEEKAEGEEKEAKTE